MNLLRILRATVMAFTLILVKMVDGQVSLGVYMERKQQLIPYLAGRTWDEAEAHCQSEGGHLASIMTEHENQEVMRLTLVDEGSLLYNKAAWIGGRRKNRIWKWADHSVWNFKNWYQLYQNDTIGESCSMQMDGGEWA